MMILLLGVVSPINMLWTCLVMIVFLYDLCVDYGHE
jgi:hypothetical protein